MSWMIYGVTGYTGLLILKEAVKRGEKPIIAGRNAEKLRELSKTYEVETRCFSLENATEVEKGLQNVKAVLHCAGPFSRTSRPMLDACLKLGVHYLDITGEIDVLEAALQRNQEAQAKNCVVIPGVGFDVVPSDCLAAQLKNLLPDATHLELGFYGWSKLSPGTTKTILENLTRGSRIRKEGKIIDLPPFELSCEANFSTKTKKIYVAAWGDVSTAYYSTGIKNITVYAAAPEWLVKSRGILKEFAKTTTHPFVQKLFGKAVDKFVKGPTEEDQKTGRIHLWGRVKNAKGETKEATLDVCEPYYLTALTAVTSVQKVLESKLKGGCYTPSLAFGPDFIQSFL